MLDGALYAIGGRSGYSDFGDVYRFQAETGWQSAPGIPPRGTAGAISHCGKLWVFGGESQSSGKVLAEVFSYAPVDKIWRTQTPLPQARNFARAVWFNNAVWVVGGSLSAGNSHAAQGSAVVEMAGLGCG
ncbi:kelch repeat-containing protein [Massilia sp. W12]|uniref:kelch repeat-containing protein n=1 Tax=Massilia sp. W12 TaxID=3126507 RepID=UPI0030CD3790